MKIDTKTILLAISLALNALGGTGVVPPVVGGPTPCAACPICPSPL